VPLKIGNQDSIIIVLGTNHLFSNQAFWIAIKNIFRQLYIYKRAMFLQSCSLNSLLYLMIKKIIKLSCFYNIGTS